jgi:hypothetical protein
MTAALARAFRLSRHRGSASRVVVYRGTFCRLSRYISRPLNCRQTRVNTGFLPYWHPKQGDFAVSLKAPMDSSIAVHSAGYPQEPRRFRLSRYVLSSIAVRFCRLSRNSHFVYRGTPPLKNHRCVKDLRGFFHNVTRARVLTPFFFNALTPPPLGGASPPPAHARPALRASPASPQGLPPLGLRPHPGKCAPLARTKNTARLLPGSGARPHEPPRSKRSRAAVTRPPCSGPQAGHPPGAKTRINRARRALRPRRPLNRARVRAVAQPSAVRRHINRS